MHTHRSYYTYKIAFFNLDSMKNVFIFIFIFDIVPMWGGKNSVLVVDLKVDIAHMAQCWLSSRRTVSIKMRVSLEKL